jgi:hypothetical protein
MPGWGIPYFRAHPLEQPVRWHFLGVKVSDFSIAGAKMTATFTVSTPASLLLVFLVVLVYGLVRRHNRVVS